MFKVGVLTISDKASRNERVDESGKAIKDIVEDFGYEVNYYNIIPDEVEDIKKELIKCSDELKCDLVLTTGGTGFSKRDVTPEATLEVMTRNAFGISEAIRAFSMTITKRAMLSRAVSVIRNETLIVNLPGSPKAVKESLEYVINDLDHGLKILKGVDSECARK
ncbi:MogA/MoaB family molybdenum cofactor biosynthesis protein [Mediannikoviicoccus vaginalis]|uniref:MogA/MoaB family molybdenum cofactor biosynthesis protein n=1 Tax=Mediannikoviicoccus vaginalis TaxID=2899727 RepID=UPI001F381273|nr:MogA/MoaB family molybdenum cofactor biosynthesis protein [Mediannikoviicoccus vaginalis]